MRHPSARYAPVRLAVPGGHVWTLLWGCPSAKGSGSMRVALYVLCARGAIRRAQFCDDARTRTGPEGVYGT